MNRHDQFLNETVLLWDKLSLELARPYSIDPQSSRFAADAGTVLTALRHAPEKFGWEGRGQKLTDRVVKEFPQHQLIVDAADTWKHGELDSADRIVTTYVQSHFAVRDDGRFRFLRNVIRLNHPRLGKFDWQEVTRSAIQFWIAREKIDLKWSGTPHDGADAYRETALLTFEPGFQVRQHAAKLQFVRTDGAGWWEPVDPEQCTFAVVECPDLLTPAPILSDRFF